MEKKGLKHKYEENFLRWDLLISVAIVIIFIIAVQLNAPCAQTVFKNLSDAYEIIISASMTMLGFIITGVSVVVVFLERDTFALFHKTQNYPLIYEVYYSTIKFLAGLSIVALVAFGLKPNGEFFFNYVILLGVIISIFRIYRCVWILKKFTDLIIYERTKNRI